jgi:VWFA-related protein
MKQLLSTLLFALPLLAADDDVVFRSDVSLARVDVRVLDRNNRAIPGLRREDFVLREGGQVREIRNFASEDMPVDVLFLLDVSGSMRPHVERIAAASRDALRVMGEKDRIAIMVFDTFTRVRMPFRNILSGVDREFQNLLRQESFNGGTEITRSLLSAVSYIAKNGRRDARRAIVILTDDETGGERNEQSVIRALANAQTVLSALIAPDAMAGMQRFPGGGRGGSTWPGSSGGSTWPGGGGGGGPLGGIILGGPLGGPRMPTGRRGPMGGGGGPMGGTRTQPAGTAEIARQSGGDSLHVDDASALEDTLNRIRQQYALHFHLPEGVKPGEERNVDVTLSASARRQYPDAEVRFRRVYITPGASGDYNLGDERPVITRNPPRTPGQLDPEKVHPASADPPPEETEATASRRDTGTSSRRRPAVSEPDGPRGVNPSVASKADQEEPEAAPAPAAPAAPATSAPAPKQGGWRVLKPGEKP